MVPLLYHPNHNIAAFGFERLHPFDGRKYRLGRGATMGRTKARLIVYHRGSTARQGDQRPWPGGTGRGVAEHANRSSDARVIIRRGGSATDDDLAPALPRSIAAARISRDKRPEGCPHLPCAHFSESR